MITEDYCSFELSKFLKEKGFDGECIGCYWDSKKTFDVNYEPLSYSDGDLRDEVILAPTHQMAMKWLREVHNLCIAPYAAAYRYDFTIDKCGTGSNICNDDVINEVSNTYEEAVESALKYCLTELI